MGRTREALLGSLVDGSPRSGREIIVETGLGSNQVYQGMARCWRGGLVLRTVEGRMEWERVNDGRKGIINENNP